MLVKLALLGFMGALGTLARYGSSVAVRYLAPDRQFPWHTLAVNVVGCFLFGVIYAVIVEKLEWGDDAQVIILTGFMGAFTTYSAFAFETSGLMRESLYTLAAANILSQNVLCIGAAFAGIFAGRAVF